MADYTQIIAIGWFIGYFTRPLRT